MIGYFAVRHVWNKADELGMARPTYKQIQKAAAKARGLRIPFPVKVGFSSFCNPFNDGLVAAMNISYKKVSFNYEWLARAVLFGDRMDFQNAFRAVIGHEVGHKVATCPRKFVFLPQCRKFINWINEYYADYYALTMALGGSRERMAVALDYQRRIDRADEDTESHPSWKRRKMTIMKCAFDPAFVFSVAQEVGCTNFAVIQTVCNYFFRSNQMHSSII